MTAKDIGRFLSRLLLLVVLLGGTGCDLQLDSAGASTRNAQVEHIDLDDEVRRVLPKGTKIYYAQVHRDRFTRIDHWYVKSLDIHSGTIRTIMSGDETGFSQILPRSLTRDGKFLLATARHPSTRRKSLLEINTHTGKWRKVANDIFGADYSSDESKIAVYYPLEPKRFHQTKSKALRIGIIDRSGGFLKRIECESNHCFHPTWTKDGNNILFIDETTPETVRIYNHKSESISIIYTTTNKNHKLFYPHECNNHILVTQEPNNQTLSSTHNITTLFLTKPSNTKSHVSSILDNHKILYLACIRGMPNYFIATEDGKTKNGTPTDLMHLSLFNSNTSKSYRLTPGPTLTDSVIYPVVHIPQTTQP